MNTAYRDLSVSKMVKFYIKVFFLCHGQGELCCTQTGLEFFLVCSVPHLYNAVRSSWAPKDQPPFSKVMQLLVFSI